MEYSHFSGNKANLVAHVHFILCFGNPISPNFHLCDAIPWAPFTDLVDNWAKFSRDNIPERCSEKKNKFWPDTSFV